MAFSYFDLATDWLKALGPTLATVVGWYQVHKLTSERDVKSEKRKRAIDRCDKLIEECIRIRERATKYHTADRDHALELELKANFADLGLGLPFLSGLGIKEDSVRECTLHVVAFKRSVQAKHFEEAHTSPLLASDIILLDIAGSASGLIRSIRACQNSMLEAAS